MNKFKVSGIAFVPVEVAMEVFANTDREARGIALELFARDRCRYIVSRSEDYGAAHSWEPSVEPIEEGRA